MRWLCVLLLACSWSLPAAVYQTAEEANQAVLSTIQELRPFQEVLRFDGFRQRIAQYDLGALHLPEETIWIDVDAWARLINRTEPQGASIVSPGLTADTKVFWTPLGSGHHGIGVLVRHYQGSWSVLDIGTNQSTGWASLHVAHLHQTETPTDHPALIQLDELLRRATIGDWDHLGALKNMGVQLTPVQVGLLNVLAFQRAVRSGESVWYWSEPAPEAAFPFHVDRFFAAYAAYLSQDLPTCQTFLAGCHQPSLTNMGSEFAVAGLGMARALNDTAHFALWQHVLEDAPYDALTIAAHFEFLRDAQAHLDPAQLPTLTDDGSFWFGLSEFAAQSQWVHALDGFEAIVTDDAPPLRVLALRGFARMHGNQPIDALPYWYQLLGKQVGPWDGETMFAWTAARSQGYAEALKLLQSDQIDTYGPSVVATLFNDLSTPVPPDELASLRDILLAKGAVRGVELFRAVMDAGGINRLKLEQLLSQDDGWSALALHILHQCDQLDDVTITLDAYRANPSEPNYILADATYTSQGDWDTAIQLAREHLAKFPNDLPGRVVAASRAFQGGEPDIALEWLTAVGGIDTVIANATDFMLLDNALYVGIQQGIATNDFDVAMQYAQRSTALDQDPLYELMVCGHFGREQLARDIWASLGPERQLSLERLQSLYFGSEQLVKWFGSTE